MKFRTTYLYPVAIPVFCAVLLATAAAAGGGYWGVPDMKIVDTTKKKASFPKKITPLVSPINPTLHRSEPTTDTPPTPAPMVFQPPPSRSTDTPSTPAPMVFQPPPGRTDSTNPRLRSMDSAMAAAPADSLPALQAEYRRVKDSIAIATGELRQDVQTGGDPIQPQDTAGIVNRRYVDTTQSSGDSGIAGLKGFRRDELNKAGIDPVLAEGDGQVETTKDGKKVRRMHLSAEKPADFVDPSISTVKKTTPKREPVVRNISPVLKAEPTVNAITAAKPRAVRSPLPSSARHLTVRSHGFHFATSASAARNASVPAATPVTPRPKPVTRMSQDDRRTVEGMASARAGRYVVARTQLEPAARTSAKRLPKRTAAAVTFYYAQSLERSGKLSDAAQAYLKLSQSSQGAYLSYCRVLARMGQRGRARTLVLTFIRQHPSSTQTVSARRLLQSL